MATAHNEVEEIDQEKSKSSTRRDLLALLGRLRKLCGHFKSVDEWIKFTQKHVYPLLEKNRHNLSEAAYLKLRESARLVDATQAGVNQACKLLQTDIQIVIDSLPIIKPTLKLVQAVAGFITGVAVVGGAAVLAYNIFSATIIIHNNGCGEIPITSEVFDITAILLPSYIPEQGLTVKFPSGKVQVESKEPNSISLTKIVSFPSWPIGAVESILFEETQELLGQQVVLDLQRGEEYSLTLNCSES
jgi:hypothetical protein